MKFLYNASAEQRASSTLMPSVNGATLKLRKNTTKTLTLGVKIAAVLILMACLQVSAKTTDAQKLSISFKNGSLDKLFAEIEKKTNYVFFYDASILKGTKLVTVEVKDALLDDILKMSLRGQALNYSIHDRTIFIKKEETKSVAVATVEGNDPPGVSVVVRSETGAPLEGATVHITKLKKTGVTNSGGESNLKNVPNGTYDVEITYIGFAMFTTSVTVVNHIGAVTASMKPAKNNLDEAQVIAYGTTSKRLNTGNVTTVKGEDIQKQPVSDPILALEGRVPGLYISQTSGMPGASYTVRLRGQNSIQNGNNPLYIVDGVPFTSTTLTNPNIGGGAVGSPSANLLSSPNGLSPFNNLNPADIESIEILKDADATAIYGSRGANGVILITTKKGKIGQSKVDINVFSGEGKVTRMYNLLDTKQYLAMRHEAFYNDSLTAPGSYAPPDPNYDYDITGIWDSTRYTNWQKALIGGTAHFTNAQASLSGGNNNTQFVLGGGYGRQTTVFPGDYNDQKASVHANINHVSNNQKFRALFTAQYVNDNNLLAKTDFTNYITLAPDAPALYDANGHVNFQNGTFNNPMAQALKTAQATTSNLIGNLNLGYEIIPGLQLKSSLGYTHLEMNQSIQTPASSIYGPASPSNRTNLFAISNVSSWIIEPQINYTKRIAQGKLDVLVGTTIQQNLQTSLGQSASGFLNDALISNIASATTIKVLSPSIYAKYRYNALFSRLNYNWEEKYLLTLTARRDGSSRFGPSKQFGNFGAVGAGWIFSKEKFVQNAIPFLSFGKLRGSYGTTGNDQITDYQYLSTYTSYTASSYQSVTGLYPTSIANPYFSWEVVKKIEGGIELGWLKDRIILNANYYRNRTNNQLVGYTLPSIDGFISIQANLPATVQNAGVELELNTINVRTKDFSWSSSINLSIPRNKLVAFPGLASSSYRNTYVIGKSLYIKQLYHYTGVDPQTGTYTFQDVNKDGQLDNNDLQPLKQITQQYFGGVLNNFSYKGLQLDLFFQFVKQTGFNYLYNLSVPGGVNYNFPVYVLHRWQNKGDITNVQKFTQTGGPAATAWSNVTNSDYAIGDASFIRMKNIALSYSLPKQWLHTARLQNARVYIQCQNLFTITGYKGLDPETQGNSLPPLRMVTAGLQLGL